MFESEVEMERRSSLLPLVLMLCLVALIVGTVVYVVFQVRSRTPLNAAQATPIVAAAVQGLGPAVIHFQTGAVKCTADETKADLNYRLLEKAGIVKLGKPAKGSVKVTLTPANTLAFDVTSDVAVAAFAMVWISTTDWLARSEVSPA